MYFQEHVLQGNGNNHLHTNHAKLFLLSLPLQGYISPTTSDDIQRYPLVHVVDHPHHEALRKVRDHQVTTTVQRLNVSAPHMMKKEGHKTSPAHLLHANAKFYKPHIHPIVPLEY